MDEKLLLQLLTKLDAIDSRLSKLETTVTQELEQVQTSLDILAADQQDDILTTLQRLELKTTAILEAQKLNVEILKVFSGDSIQH